MAASDELPEGFTFEEDLPEGFSFNKPQSDELPEGFSFEKESQPEEKSFGDHASEAFAPYGSGTGSLISLVGDLYGLTTGDMDNAASRLGDQTKEYWQSRKSDNLKGKEESLTKHIESQDTWYNKAGSAFWGTVSDKDLLASFVFEQAPMMVLTGGVGKGASAGVKLVGGSAKAAAKTATGAAVGTGAALGGSDAGGQAHEQLMDLPDELWAENPQFKQMVDQGKDPQQAKEEIALGLSRNNAIATAAVSLGLSKLPGASHLEKKLAGVGIQGKGKLVEGAKGFAGEAIQEAGEEGFGKFGANLAASQVDPDQDLSSGVGEAVGKGAAAGIFGGVSGFTSGSKDSLDSDGIIKGIAEAETIDAAAAQLDKLTDTKADVEVDPEYGESTVKQPDILAQLVEASKAGFDPDIETGSQIEQEPNVGVPLTESEENFQPRSEIDQQMEAAAPQVSAPEVQAEQPVPEAAPIEQEPELPQIEEIEAETAMPEVEETIEPTGPTEIDAQPVGDTLLQWGRKQGRFNTDAAKAEGLDLTIRKGAKGAFSKKGRDLDEMAIKAHEDGYIDSPDKNLLIDKMNEELAGNPQYTKQGLETVAEQDFFQQQKDIIQKHVDSIDVDFPTDLAKVSTVESMAEFEVEWNADVPVQEVPEATQQDTMAAALVEGAIEVGVDPATVEQLVQDNQNDFGTFADAIGTEMQKVSTNELQPRSGQEGTGSTQEAQTQGEIQGELLGAPPVAQQNIADAKARVAQNLTGKDVPADIDGGLFAEGKQTDLTDLDSQDGPAYKDGNIESFNKFKSNFLDIMPADTEAEDVMANIDKFSKQEQRVLRALDKGQWLGFDYPSQAISQAMLNPESANLTPGEKSAIGALVNSDLGSPESKALIDVIVEREYERENGDIVKVERNAEEIIKEIDGRIDGVKLLINCLGK